MIIQNFINNLVKLDTYETNMNIITPKDMITCESHTP